MSNEKSKRKPRFVKGLLAGAAIGAAAVAMLTPKTGKETTKIVKDAYAKAKIEGVKILKSAQKLEKKGEQLIKKNQPQIKKITDISKDIIKKIKARKNQDNT